MRGGTNFHMKQKKDSLLLITNVVIVLGVGGSPVYYFVKRYLDLRSTKCLVSENILKELDDGKTALTSNRHTRVSKEYGGKKYNFVAAFLNHDVYDSLINSGRINYLDVSMQ